MTTKQTYDKKPVIQIDYTFLTSKQDSTTDDSDTTKQRERSTILSAVDVNTGLTFAVVVQHKGHNDYAANELTRFMLEAGRSNGVLHSDQ